MSDAQLVFVYMGLLVLVCAAVIVGVTYGDRLEALLRRHAFGLLCSSLLLSIFLALGYLS